MTLHDYFDDHHHHFHHPAPLPPPPPPPPSTPPPPPPPLPEPEEPEEQPRVKKYSYFYLSRSLWYIPLYFTVWFTFYVTWLILQSIGRHKVKSKKIRIEINCLIHYHDQNFLSLSSKRLIFQITQSTVEASGISHTKKPLKKLIC